MRKLFDKEEARNTPLNGEWVSLRAGDIYVREMTGVHSAELYGRSARPEIDPRGGVDPGESVIWQICFCCYATDEEDSVRVFDGMNRNDIDVIQRLGFTEFSKLLKAINRVNGRDATEAEVLRDFTAATGGAEPSQ